MDNEAHPFDLIADQQSMATKIPVTAAPDQRLPRYLQIRDELMRRICARAWTEGQALPAEDKLAAEFAVSLGTMRKAMTVLVDDGMVERIHGKGTFITRAFERISMLRFIGYSLASQNEIPDSATLKMQVRLATAQARKKLALPADDKLLYLHRTRSAKGEVLLSEHIYLPYKKFSKLEAYLRKNSPAMLYPAYDAVCGVLISRAADVLTVCPLPAAETRLFKLAKNTLGVRIERLMLEHSGQAIEWRISYVTTERFQYAVETR